MNKLEKVLTRKADKTVESGEAVIESVKLLYFTKEDNDFLYDCYTSAKFLNNKADKKMLIAILNNASRNKEDFVLLVKFSQLRTTIKDACVSAEAKEIAERISNYKL